MLPREGDEIACAHPSRSRLLFSCVIQTYGDSHLRSSRSEERLKISYTAFVLPVTVAGGLGAGRAADFLGKRFRLELRLGRRLDGRFGGRRGGRLGLRLFLVHGVDNAERALGCKVH